TLNLAEGDSMPFITPEGTTADLPQNSVSATRSPNAIKVPTDTLDNILPDNSLANLTLAKMDIEGAEILALKGATSMLEQQRPYVWILEILDDVNYFGYQKQDILNLLKNYGYSLYSYNADTNQLKSITLDQKQGNNVLAIADSALDFVRDRLIETQKIS
ncbi:MAG: FkbM family methyltransferase, partial [Moorea sp. SIO3C2]|nr:FkbM family methyltransferase [Moorena sp. SIO3C2]